MSQERSKKLELAKEIITISGTVITTGVVVTSLIHDFICTEEHPCFVCKRIKKWKESREKKANQQAQPSNNEAQLPKEQTTTEVEGKVKISTIDANAELNTVKEVDE